MSNRYAFASLFMILAPIVVLGQESPVLRWSLKKGDRVRVLSKNVSTARSELVGVVKSHITQFLVWDVQDVQAEAAAIVERNNRLRFTMVTSFGSTVVDTADKAPEESTAELLPDLRRLLDIKISFNLTPKGKVIGAKLDDKGMRTLKSLPGVGPGFQGFQFVEQFQRLAGALPGKAVKVGDAWKEKAVLPSSQGDVHIEAAFRYEGTGEIRGRTLHRIHYQATYQSTGQPVDNASKKQSPGKDIGVIWFDAQAGRVAVYHGDTLETQVQVLEGKEFPLQVATSHIHQFFHRDSSQFAGKRPGQTWQDEVLETQFQWCPAAVMTVGSPQTEPWRDVDEQPARVTLTTGYWMSAHEVTQSQWTKIMGDQSWNGKPHVREGGDYPATYVTWPHAIEFCRRLSVQGWRREQIPNDWEYQIPTEAQWEHACRAGTTTAYHFGEDVSKASEFAWVKQSSEPFLEHPQQVGRKQPNAWGLLDMHGNVWEWCRDTRGNLPISAYGADPVGLAGSYASARSGDYNDPPQYCRSATRHWFAPKTRQPNLGLRVILAPIEP